MDEDEHGEDEHLLALDTGTVYMHPHPPATYLPVWCVYATGVCLQNFICIGAGDSCFACFLVLNLYCSQNIKSDPFPAASQSNSVGDACAIASVRTNARLISG